MKKIISGVEIDLIHPDIKPLKTAAEIKKIELFSHLDEDSQSAASKELLEALKPTKATKAVETVE